MRLHVSNCIRSWPILQMFPGERGTVSIGNDMTYWSDTQSYPKSIYIVIYDWPQSQWAVFSTSFNASSLTPVPDSFAATTLSNLSSTGTEKREAMTAKPPKDMIARKTVSKDCEYAVFVALVSVLRGKTRLHYLVRSRVLDIQHSVICSNPETIPPMSIMV
jgi:hypothetical protein